MLAEAIFNTDGPVAVRYPRGGEGAYRESCLEAESILRIGRDVTIVTYGTMINQALTAADMLEKEHIEAEVIKLGIIKPNNFELTMSSLMKTSSLLVVEEVCAAGCVGQQILALCAENGIELKSAKLANLGDGIIPQGTVAELLHDNGLDAAGLAESVKNMIETKHVVLQ